MDTYQGAIMNPNAQSQFNRKRTFGSVSVQSTPNSLHINVSNTNGNGGTFSFTPSLSSASASSPLVAYSPGPKLPIATPNLHSAGSSLANKNARPLPPFLKRQRSNEYTFAGNKFPNLPKLPSTASKAILNAKLSPDQSRVVDAVRSGDSVFFTGVAGTGKSFLLSYLMEMLPKESTFFSASTGIAAVNIKGTTVHSFAGVGLGDGSVKEITDRVIKNANAKKRWNTCHTLVIDEVSMLDGAFFDKLENVARVIRKSVKPFGGIQLVLTGDFLQLPSIGAQGTISTFCFEANSWSKCITQTIQLDHVFRQQDQSFVSVLGKLRWGTVDDSVLSAFKGCINRKFDSSDGIEPTRLYPTKREVQHENQSRLVQLKTAEVTFKAMDTGDPTHIEMLKRNAPAVSELVLKEGSQVMLLKNISTESGLVNGSRGVVIGFEKETQDQEWIRINPQRRWPIVRFTNGSETTINPDKWSIEIAGKTLATRQQVPLLLAWALTVHKAQGMTLDRVELNLHGVFEFGQAYVALSRIRSLESLCLKDSFPVHVVKANAKAKAFYTQLSLLNSPTTNSQASFSDSSATSMRNSAVSDSLLMLRSNPNVESMGQHAHLKMEANKSNPTPGELWSDRIQNPFSNSPPSLEEVVSPPIQEITNIFPTTRISAIASITDSFKYEMKPTLPSSSPGSIDYKENLAPIFKSISAGFSSSAPTISTSTSLPFSTAVCAFHGTPCNASPMISMDLDESSLQASGANNSSSTFMYRCEFGCRFDVRAI